MGFFPPFSFQFHVDYVNKSDVSASRNSFQNAAIHEKKTHILLTITSSRFYYLRGGSKN